MSCYSTGVTVSISAHTSTAVFQPESYCWNHRCYTLGMTPAKRDI